MNSDYTPFFTSLFLSFGERLLTTKIVSPSLHKHIPQNHRLNSNWSSKVGSIFCLSPFCINKLWQQLDGVAKPEARNQWPHSANKSVVWNMQFAFAGKQI